MLEQKFDVDLPYARNIGLNILVACEEMVVQSLTEINDRTLFSKIEDKSLELPVLESEPRFD